MPYVHFVIALALIQFFYFGLQVGQARGRYKVAAPATTGDEIFERYFRVQMNTLEQLVLFVPAILIFAQYWSPYIAAGAGGVYLVGRLLYFFSYVKDPKKRELGYAVTVIPIAFLVGGAIVGALRAMFYM